MKVAIHQPNYMPWLGYFAKMARADVFVFLDDVQFTKNGYTNRVQVRNGDRPHWLTVPVKVHLGDAINGIVPTRPGWAEQHLASLRNFYRTAPAFSEEWPDIERLYASLPDGDIAGINIHVVMEMARMLGLPARCTRSSAMDIAESRGDERLARIVESIAPGGTYLSGEGGRKYQSEAAFESRNVRLDYVSFVHPQYRQGSATFIPGLSVLDALFEIGREATARLILPERT